MKNVVLSATIILGVGLFIVFPYILTNFVGYYEETKPLLFNLIDGVIRIIIFLLYIVVISFMKDVKKIFQYHGAEHKAVHCYEAGKKLDIKNKFNYFPNEDKENPLSEDIFFYSEAAYAFSMV